MTGTKSRERVGSSQTSNKKSKADAPAIKNKRETPQAGRSNGVAPEPEVLIVPSSSTESQARETESKRNQSPKRRERDADPAGKKERKRRKPKQGGAGKGERASSKSNGVAREPEVLVVPSSSAESRGGEREEPKGDRSAKMRELLTGSAVQNKRKHQEREDGDESRDDSKLCSFPMNRIKTIAKSEESDSRINHEAYFVINKATEKFIEQLCEDAYALAAARDRKKSFQYNHLSSLVCEWKRYDFLSDFVPVKMKAEDALAERKPEET
ncbi:uncharacterized protein LOC115752253 [Rhodamnia argentea]|uniref:Uncharacterized protein LOC115752253 n=1 Tax=Rhodamnia argentea TaxID=178133 RepID=A0A8B8QGL3_9MYRT|nr:uncharacterized protein LOC115752253 [Rhodamnia argentea]XP_030546215.1 uncharacterized protein LOC115752253 [Rhodamnia argentea]